MLIFLSTLLVAHNKPIGFTTGTFEVSHTTDDFNKRVVYVLFHNLFFLCINNLYEHYFTTKTKQHQLPLEALPVCTNPKVVALALSEAQSS